MGRDGRGVSRTGEREQNTELSRCRHRRVERKNGWMDDWWAGR